MADGRLTCRLEGDVGPFLAAIAGAPITDLTIEPARLEEAFLEFYETEDEAGATPAAGGAGVNRALLAHTWRANRWRLLIVSVGLLALGHGPAGRLRLLRVADAGRLRESAPIPQQFAQFGGGDIFSLTGAVALGFVHPIAVGLNLGLRGRVRGRRPSPASASAGRSRSSSPDRSRAGARLRDARVAAAVFVAVTLGALTLGSLFGATFDGPGRRARGRRTCRSCG